MGYGFKENELSLNSESIEINGIYGETLKRSEIQSIEVVSKLPEITLRTNGFALGTTNKGYFKTEKGEIIKLILNSDNAPYILFTMANGKKIYYSAKQEPTEDIMVEMNEAFPDLVYKQ